MLDLHQFFKQFQDYLAPKLDTYEQALYLYIFRYTRFVDQREAILGFKSARRRMATGIGEKGKPMSEGTCYEKLKSLDQKRCIRLLDSTSKGSRIELYLPSEIDGAIPVQADSLAVDIEQVDFFENAENRRQILQREDHKCFYCLRTLDDVNHVIEHVESRPDGNNSYRNVVAACRSCNNKKGAIDATDYVRNLFRAGFLNDDEIQGRLEKLDQLKAGFLRPPGNWQN